MCVCVCVCVCGCVCVSVCVCVCMCVLTSPLPAASPPAPAGAAAVWRPRCPDRLAEIPPAATRVRADPYSTGRQTTLLSVVPLNLRKRVQHRGIMSTLVP